MEKRAQGMSDLQQYNFQKLEIDRLNQQINMIAGFYFSFYKRKIKNLENKLDVEGSLKRRYRLEAQKLKGTNRTSDVARELISNRGINKLSLKEIAKISYLSFSRVKNISSEMKRINED